MAPRKKITRPRAKDERVNSTHYDIPVFPKQVWTTLEKSTKRQNGLPPLSQVSVPENGSVPAGFLGSRAAHAAHGAGQARGGGAEGPELPSAL